MRRKALFVMAAALIVALSAQPAFAAPQTAMAPGPVVKPMYEVERQPMHSTNMTIMGEMAQFVNMESETLQKTLNMEIQDFYDSVLEYAAKDGIPYPSVNFTVETKDEGGAFTLTTTSTTKYPDNTKMEALQIVLDDKDYKVLKSGVAAEEIINLSNTADGFYVDGGVSMVPFRKVSEFFGYNVEWDGQSGHVDTGAKRIAVTPSVNNYGGTMLEAAPVNRFGSIHVPLSFFNDILALYCSEDEEQIIIAKQLFDEDNTQTKERAVTVPAQASTSAGIVTGSVIDATMNGVTVVDLHNNQYTFFINDEAKPNTHGVTLDAYVTVSFNGAISGSDASNASVVKIESAAVNSDGKKQDATTFIGVVVDASMNTVTIKTVSGRSITFSTMDADKTKSGGVVTGSTVGVLFTGEVVGEDASKAAVISVTAVPQSE